MDTTKTLKNIPVLFLLVLVLVTTIYLQTLSYDFAYDDLLLIQSSASVIHPAFEFSHLTAIFSTPTPPGDLYRPLATATYWLNYLSGGLNPLAFHAVNVLLYILLSLLVYKLFRLFLPSEDSALWAAIVFAVHPIHVEAVANIVGRAELLAAICGVGALLLLDRAWQRERTGTFNTLTMLSALLYLGALLSKESAFTFFPLILAFILIRKVRLTQIIPHMAVSVLALFMRYNALGSAFLVTPESTAMNPENPLLGLPFTERLIPALKVLGDYLFNILAPFYLTADYSRMPDVLLAETYSIAGFCSILLLAAYLFILLRTRGTGLFLMGFWFLITFALTCNIFLPIGTIMADRLALVPSIGIIGMIAGRCHARWPTHFTLASCLLSVLFAALTVFQLPIWRNNETLFKSMVTRTPENPKALYNYGVFLHSAVKDHDQAAVYFRATLGIVPEHLYSMKALSDIASMKGDYARVEYWDTRILRSYPQEVKVKEQLEALQAARAQK